MIAIFPSDTLQLKWPLGVTDTACCSHGPLLVYKNCPTHKLRIMGCSDGQLQVPVFSNSCKYVSIFNGDEVWQVKREHLYFHLGLSSHRNSQNWVSRGLQQERHWLHLFSLLWTTPKSKSGRTSITEVHIDTGMEYIPTYNYIRFFWNVTKWL